MFSGKAIQLKSLADGMVELVLDMAGSSVNTLNTAALGELDEALTLLETEKVSGLLVSSAKSTFIVGADVTEFPRVFAQESSLITGWLLEIDSLFNRLENLPFPSVAIVNSLALGGGCELALSCDYRVMNQQGKMGLPEVGLGLCPGWGGTVRLSRLLDLEAALSMMISGKPMKAEKALSSGLVDQVADDENLQATAMMLLIKSNSGELDYLSQRSRKQNPKTSTEEQASLKALNETYTARLSANYPAAIDIVETVSQHIGLPFDEALRLEAACFATLSKTSAASSLIGLFFNDQVLKKKTRTWVKQADPVKKGAVLGAGIMGGGVSYQSAINGIPIVMKDIQQDALDLGLGTVNKLLDRQIKKGFMDTARKDSVLSDIHSTLDYSDFDQVDLVVEAVVENVNIKASVLKEVEGLIPDNSILTSNTSTISIDTLAEGLQRPELFCGMHFFNPVPQMQLVEIIRGKASNDASIARSVAYASAMGKTPIVVNDCPGFLVNRVLFPYYNGLNRLLKDGVDFERIDQVMENFGWPMGPAYLADVIGLDTMVHADKVMQEGFPERMGHDDDVVIEHLLAEGSLGQKNGKGFYEYGTDENGRCFKKASALAMQERGGEGFNDNTDIDAPAIIDRMMIPLCTESIRCLEDGIVDTAAEVDMGLILGLGFPRFRGGALRYVDTLGFQVFSDKVSQYSSLGGLYSLTDAYAARLKANQTFY